MNAFVLLAAIVFAAEAQAMSCSVALSSGLNFGDYNMLSSQPLTTSGELVVTCTGAASSDMLTVQLSRGASSSFSARTLIKGSESLRYDIFLDAALTTIFGDNTGGSVRFGPVAPADTGGTVGVFMYGALPAHQSVSAGTYTDTIVATVNF